MLWGLIFCLLAVLSVFVERVSADDAGLMLSEIVGTHCISVFCVSCFPNIRRNRHSVICFYTEFRKIFNFRCIVHFLLLICLAGCYSNLQVSEKTV